MHLTHQRPSPPSRPRPRVARTARLAGTFIVGLVVAATATTATIGVADAAPPPLKLTATPNPVTIPIDKTTGTYILDWSTGSNLPAEFTGSTDGGPESGTIVQTPFGNVPVNIDFGHTHTWRLYTNGDHRRPLKTVYVTTRRPDDSCARQCVKSVVITPHGTFADFDVVLTTKVKAVELTAHKVNEPVSSAMFSGNTDHWQTQLLSLDPGTGYLYDLTATDEAGNKYTWSDSFSTLKRQVTVTFDSIHIIDDSDDLSDGDLEFWFHQNGVWDNNTYGPVSAGTGDTIHPGHTMVSVGAKDDLQIGLFGDDDDCDVFDGLCSEGIGPGLGDGGSSSQQDWATAWTTVNTFDSGPAEFFSASFSLSTTGHALEFSGAGTYSVTYI